MAVQTVSCPGCKATLKAPEQMAGKKAKCKKCGVSFRIPGGDEPTGDSVGDSQFLSAMDLPTPAAGSPFDFGGDPEPAPKPKPKPAEAEEPPKPAKKSAAVPKAETARPAPKPVEKLPARKPKVEDEDDEDAIPAAAVVEEDEPAEPAPAASADPFAFSEAPAPAPAKSKKKRDDDEPREEKKPKAKAKPKDEEPAPAGNAFSFGDDSAPAGLTDDPEDDEDDDAPVVDKKDEKKKPAKRGYQSRSGSGGGGSSKLIIAAGVFGLIVAAGVGGAIIYTNKPPETANNDKKEPDPNATPTPPDSNNTGTKGTETPKTPEPPKPPDKGTPPKKDPPGKKPAGGGPMLSLAPGRTINFLPMAEKPELIQEPSNRLMILPTLPATAGADSFAAARKVFPPRKRDIDIGVVWETAKGLQGAGQKLLLGIYSPLSGKQANQVAFDGDGSAEPVCDLSADANLFAHGHTGQSKVNVWDTRSGSKIVDGFNPYSDAKNKDLKLAAVYLTEPPLVFVTVSTTGAVHAFNVKSKQSMAGEFVPPKLSSKPLVAGKHIAPGPSHLSVVVYAAGSFYQVGIGPTVDGKEIVRLDGDVGRSFGISGSPGGRMIFAFETDEKKDKAVMEVRADGKHVFYRWPEKDAGDPSGVAWVDDGLVMVASTRGSCVWFEAEGTDFKPIGLARTPNDKGLHVASDGHWALLPDPANAKQCVLVEYSKPQSGIVGALDSVKQPPSALLTDKGLLK